MAGSRDKSLHSSFADPVLAARLDALKLLADRVSDRVMVLDRDLTIIYANQSGWSGSDHRTSSGRPTKCYEAFLKRADPCGACPATKVFESAEVRAVSCSTDRDGSACGMQEAYPLLSSRGETTSVLVILKGTAGGGDTEASAAGGRHRTEGDAPPAAPRLGDLIGDSVCMRQLFEMIHLVADSQASVLLHGESGTGKELVARSIHHLSARRDRPFVVVDCGSLPPTLLESELFGHVKGAFTGAVSSKKGLFEEANGGTIFLDEIADTNAHFQSKLLRVLQEGEIKPVGSSRSVKADVRVITATNKDLTDLMRAKSFRADLYYRLAVIPLSLPPLRDRREDIPLLAKHFVERASRRNIKPLRQITDEAMQALIQAPWPGNVRELQHMVERVVVTASGSQFTPQDFFGARAAMPPSNDLRTVARNAVKIAERARIVEALRVADGKRARAALLLKISRASLYTKLHAYKID